MKHVPISITMIHKGKAADCLKALDSAYGALAAPSAKLEAVIVDTGSTRKQLRVLEKSLKLYPNARLVKRPDLSIELRPLITKYLGPEFAAEYRDHYGHTTGILNFAEARQVAADEAKYPVQFWIDSDDVLVETRAGEMREFVDLAFLSEDRECDCLFLDYDYAFDDDDGACITTLRRERFVDTTNYRWKGACHETLIPAPGNIPKTGFFPQNGAKLVHTEARKPHRISDIRNYTILAHDAALAKERGEEVDPRTIYYMANAARGLQLLDKAQRLYAQFDLLSGSEDDRFGAAYYRGVIDLDSARQRPVKALDAFFESIRIKPFDPRGYFGIAQAYANMHRPKESLMWYEAGLSRDVAPDQVHSYNPLQVNFRPHLVAAVCYKELHQRDKAVECAHRALQSRPQSREAHDFVNMMENWARGEALAEGVETTLRNMICPSPEQFRRFSKKILDELPAVPERLEMQGYGKPEDPDPREPRPEIVFYCPGNAHKWSAASRHKGIGGSEKMVIILAEALQATGRVNCTVYANTPPDARGVHDTGVLWRHPSEIDTNKERAAVIYWRCPAAVLSVTPPADKRILWLHDVTFPDAIPADALELYDAVQVQSEFHADYLRPAVPEDKIWVSRNAIEIPKDLGATPRHRKLVTFCSSWDRGLLTTCEIVRRAQEIDPEISLTVTYGIGDFARKSWARGVHRAIPDVGRDISVDVYERLVNEALDSVDAEVLGNVNWEQMEKLHRSAGVWLYPTRFPEISCMTAMEAQANGSICLTTGFGALAETILPEAQGLSENLPALPESGVLSDRLLQDCAERLVDACNVPDLHPNRAAVAARAVDAYRVDTLAENWLSRLEIPEAAGAVCPGQSSETCPTEGRESFKIVDCFPCKGYEVTHAEGQRLQEDETETETPTERKVE